MNPHMIHQWKGLDLEITAFNYHYDLTPSQTSRYVIRGYYFIMRDGVEYPTSGASQKRRSSKS